MRWLFLFVILEFTAAFALLDCVGRKPDDFEGGAPDRKSWIQWLVVGVLTAWFLVGNGIVLGYYFNVVKRRPA